MDTILDRPRALRYIGLTQILFGVFGLLATIGLAVATFLGNPTLVGVGYTYATVIFIGVALPCLVIGNYVDDLRRNAVIAQIIYSTLAVILTAYFLYVFGVVYHWTFPWFDTTFDVYIGNLAASILFVQAVFASYLIVNWRKVVPPRGTKIERDKSEARRIETGFSPAPYHATILAPDGETELSYEESERILQIRKLETEEGMAVLCSNCGGATPLEKANDDNTLNCDFCGVRLALSSVFVPCINHPEYLAATSCAVCGEHYCRRCLTVQEPPVDEKWEGSAVFLCQKCFEGRYRPAVTTSSLVIPIDKLFGQASGRFSKLGRLYASFLGKYAAAMRWVLEFGFHFIGRLGKSGDGFSSSGGLSSGGRSGGGGDDACSGLLVIIIIIIAIPIIVALLMLAAGIVIIPILFYAGLMGVAYEAIKIMRHTDFVTLDEAREKGVLKKKVFDKRESKLREDTRSWEQPGRKPVRRYKTGYGEVYERRI